MDDSDATGKGCKDCHPDDPNEPNSFKFAAHDSDEDGDGCRLCHSDWFSEDCTNCHPNVP